MMIGYRDFVAAIRELDLGPDSRVLAHVALPPFGEVEGGVEAVLGALLATCDCLIMPVFTYRTTITPAFGPANNALGYGLEQETNLEADIFRRDLPADASMGQVAEALRRCPQSSRSAHPILSFCGVNAEEGLATQSLEEPLAPIGWLAEHGGYILMAGVDHTASVSLHFAERQAGRKQFLRWALTPAGVAECPHCPGCSGGFQAIANRLDGVASRVPLGMGAIEVVPLRDLVHIAVGWLRQNPLALLCLREDCAHCRAVKESVGKVV